MNRERRRRRDRSREETLVEENPNPEEVDQSGRIWNEGFYLAFHILLPLFIAGIIWGRKAIVARLILQLDRSWLAVISPTFSKREKLLKWIMKHVPYMEGGLPTLWKDGAQLCTLINSVVPGACSNPHRHWKKPPTHGQALAYKYLGVPPIFTDTDLNQRAFTSAVEKSLIDYMLAVQQAISKLSRDDEELTFCNHYVARGMGLVTGEQYRRTVVYVYPNVRPVGDLFINIRGPYGTHGSATLKADDLRRRQRGVVAKCEDSKCDIDVTIELEAERAKVMFLPKNTGVYEICLTTNGEHLAGSPYNINVEKNTSGIIEELTSIVTKEKVSKIRCDTVEVPEWFAKQSRSLLFKSTSAVVNDEVNNNVNSFVAEDKQIIEDKQSKDVQYEPDLLEGHTKEASSVSEQHTDVEAPDCGKGLSDVSTGNVKETPTHKRRLTKCKAITDDYDPETAPHLPNLVAEHQPLVRPPPNFRENFERRRDFWNRMSTSPHSSTVSLNESAKTTRPVVALGETRQCRSFDYIDRRRRSQRGEFGLLREKYRSVDELSFPSLKERRRMFLRDADADGGGASREERAVSLEPKRTRNYFGSIHERIKLFDSGFVDDKSQCSSSDASQDADRRELAEYGAVKRKIKERFERRSASSVPSKPNPVIKGTGSCGSRAPASDGVHSTTTTTNLSSLKVPGSLSALGGPVRQHRVVGASKSCSNLDQVRERYDD